MRSVSVFNVMPFASTAPVNTCPAIFRVRFDMSPRSLYEPDAMYSRPRRNCKSNFGTQSLIFVPVR